MEEHKKISEIRRGLSKILGIITKIIKEPLSLLSLVSFIVFKDSLGLKKLI